MRAMKTNNFVGRLLRVTAVAAVAMLANAAQAAVPGITGTHFDLEASAAHITQPDGATVYSWGYGCSAQPTGSAPDALQLPATGCPTMQIPGPTLIVHQGDTITITLTNNLPAAAGRTSILFPGFTLDPLNSTGTPGALTLEAASGGGTIPPLPKSQAILSTT